jgi:hypothetical protein
VAAARKEWGPGEYEAAIVAAALGSDTTRPHLCAPFGIEMNGRGFVVATDGHRLHAVAVAGASPETKSEAWRKYARKDAPPAEAVIPWESKFLGTIEPLDTWRHYPAKWDTSITFAPVYAGTATGRLRASLITGSGKKERIVHILGGPGGPGGAGMPDGVPVDWLKTSRADFAPVSVALHYLADAVDFIGTGTVCVWSGEKSTHPLVFTATAEPLTVADRFAVVMPRRL